MQKKLPVHISPGFETECYHNVRLSILFSHANLRTWILSHFVNLVIQSSISDRFPMVRFEEHLDVYHDILEEKPLNPSKSIITSVCQSIESGSWVLLFLNWRNLDCSDHFGSSEDLIHECLIYGYDDERSEFDILAFDVNGQSYGRAKLSYEECEREFSLIYKEKNLTHQWFAYYGFPAVSIRLKKTADVEMDNKKIFFALDRGKIPSTIKDGNINWFAAGGYVSEALGNYILQVSNGRPLPSEEYPLWNISNYKLILHNKLMIEKIDSLLNKSDPSKHKVLDRIKKFYLRRRNLLLKVTAYTKKFQQNGQKPLLLEISKTYKNVFECEKRANPIFMEYLVQDKLNEF